MISIIPGKKGALFHWIILGLAAALGIFALAVLEPDVGLKIKGEWQMNMLDNYLEGEKELLKLDTIATSIGREIIPLLAGKGGYVQDSECGRQEKGVQEINYWNNGNKLCFPDLNKEINFSFNERWANYYPQSYDIIYDSQELVGKAESDLAIKNSLKNITYAYQLKPHFRVDIGYEFAEYEQLKQEASVLLNFCGGKGNLQNCLEQKKPEYWKFSSCENEEFEAEGMKVAFCVKKSLNYILGLDFNYVPKLEVY